MSELTYTSNDDGSLNIKVEDKDVRYVKESDLLAVKGASETKGKEWETEKATLNTNLAEANRLRDEDHQNLLKEQTTVTQLRDQYKDFDAFKTKAGELTTVVETHTEAMGKLEKEVADRIRKTLTKYYKVKEDTLKDKDLPQLRSLEESARILGTGVPAGAANYDGGPSGPAGDNVPEKPIDRAKRIIEELGDKGHVIGGKGKAPVAA